MSIDIPEGFTVSLERAEIVLNGIQRGQIRIVAVRKDPPYLITVDDAKRFAIGGDMQNPRSFSEQKLSGYTGFFSSRSRERHFFSTVIEDTLIMLSGSGVDQADAEAAIESILAGLTINSTANKSHHPTA